MDKQTIQRSQLWEANCVVYQACKTPCFSGQIPTPKPWSNSAWSMHSNSSSGGGAIHLLRKRLDAILSQLGPGGSEVLEEKVFIVAVFNGPFPELLIPAKAASFDAKKRCIVIVGKGQAPDDGHIAGQHHKISGRILELCKRMHERAAHIAALSPPPHPSP
jgi:hypothetical protein